jgi:hypothetical protein
MTDGTLMALLASILSVCPVQGWCSDIFVVDARGADLTVGQILDGTKPLQLAVGQRVTLVTSDGRTIKLKGPSDTPPVPEGEVNSGEVLDSLKGLMKTREADTFSAGIIRQGNAIVDQPSPWLVEIGHSGDRCLVDGERTVLWRADVPTGTNILEIAPTDRSWSASAPWPQWSDKLALPSTMKLNNGQTYLLSLDAVQFSVTVHVIPQSVRSQAAKAAWMIEMGCESQARSLVGALQ